jgi:hypothetical protein
MGAVAVEVAVGVAAWGTRGTIGVGVIGGGRERAGGLEEDIGMSEEGGTTEIVEIAETVGIDR